MPVDKIKKSASELVEFFSTDSPYSELNKGWLTENIFLNLSPDQDKPSKELGQIVEVSFYSKPIIQILLILFVVISLSLLLAFSPLYLFN